LSNQRTHRSAQLVEQTIFEGKVGRVVLETDRSIVALRLNWDFVIRVGLQVLGWFPLAEIFALAWVFIAFVISEVGLDVVRWFTLGFDYAGNGFGPSTGCAGPSRKPRVFLKNELTASRSHDHSFPQAGVDYQSARKFKLHRCPQFQRVRQSSAGLLSSQPPN